MLEDYRARLWEAEAGLSDIITQSLQLVSGTASTPTLFPPPPSAPPAAAYIVFNPLAHDRMELVNLYVSQFARPVRVLPAAAFNIKYLPIGLSHVQPAANTCRPRCSMPPELQCRLKSV